MANVFQSSLGHNLPCLLSKSVVKIILFILPFTFMYSSLLQFQLYTLSASMLWPFRSEIPILKLAFRYCRCSLFVTLDQSKQKLLMDEKGKISFEVGEDAGSSSAAAAAAARPRSTTNPNKMTRPNVAMLPSDKIKVYTCQPWLL